MDYKLEYTNKILWFWLEIENLKQRHLFTVALILNTE